MERESSDKASSEMREQPKNIYFAISIAISAVVISVTAFLYIYSMSIEKDTAQYMDSKSEYEQRISELKSNKEVASYDIVKNAKQGIEKSIERSEAQKYISEIYALKSKYSIEFTWFSFDWENISTSAKAAYKIKRAWDNDSVALVSNFIRDFRTEQWKIFTLNPIWAISGDMLKREFEVWFKLK